MLILTDSMQLRGAFTGDRNHQVLQNGTYMIRVGAMVVTGVAGQGKGTDVGFVYWSIAPERYVPGWFDVTSPLLPLAKPVHYRVRIAIV